MKSQDVVTYNPTLARPSAPQSHPSPLKASPPDQSTSHKARAFPSLSSTPGSLLDNARFKSSVKIEMWSMSDKRNWGRIRVGIGLFILLRLLPGDVACASEDAPRSLCQKMTSYVTRLFGYPAPPQQQYDIEWYNPKAHAKEVERIYDRLPSYAKNPQVLQWLSSCPSKVIGYVAQTHSANSRGAGTDPSGVRGFIFYLLNSHHAQIVLIAVDSEAENPGVRSQLLQYVQRRIIIQKRSFVYVLAPDQALEIHMLLKENGFLAKKIIWGRDMDEPDKYYFEWRNPTFPLEAPSDPH